MTRPAKGKNMDTAVTVYTTSWCGYCIRLKSQLQAAGIAFREIDIESDASAARFVQEINGGNQTVPTVVLASGQVLTNPSVHEVRMAAHDRPAEGEVAFW